MVAFDCWCRVLEHSSRIAAIDKRRRADEAARPAVFAVEFAVLLVRKIEEVASRAFVFRDVESESQHRHPPDVDAFAFCEAKRVEFDCYRNVLPVAAIDETDHAVVGMRAPDCIRLDVRLRVALPVWREVDLYRLCVAFLIRGAGRRQRHLLRIVVIARNPTQSQHTVRVVVIVQNIPIERPYSRAGHKLPEQFKTKCDARVFAPFRLRHKRSVLHEVEVAVWLARAVHRENQAVLDCFRTQILPKIDDMVVAHHFACLPVDDIVLLRLIDVNHFMLQRLRH